MDYAALITSEHADKPKFMALVALLCGTVDDISSATRSLPQAFDVDTAIGDQLDIVGQWIGQARVIPGVLTLGFFGFSDNVAAANFGEERDVSIGGRFWNEGEPFSGTAVLSDPEYRLVLKSKIIRNQYGGTTAELVTALQTIFNASAHIDDDGTMGLRLVINSPLSTVSQSLITNFDILPRPAGVGFREIIYSTFDARALDVVDASATL
jgi:hypothetical protein